jgi:predicted site-specific integrase-resolvase
LYARVSSHDQPSDLGRQLGRLLADPTVQCIVVEHPDRLARLGSE